MYSTQVGNELKAIRNRNNLTLENVEEQLGIKKNTLSIYENNSEKIQMGTLEKLLNFYNEDIYIFFKNVSEYIHKTNNKEKEE